jgi:chorismate mutase/prephenate dehydratase
MDKSKLKVAYLGPEGTFTHAALISFFGQNVHSIPLKTISDVFDAVGVQAEFAVLPIENSTEGAVTNTLDCLIASNLKICGEVEIPVKHCLLQVRGNKEPIRQIFSHPQAFAQCRQWISKNYPGIKTVETTSTGQAAALIKNEPFSAAIAGPFAKEMYQLESIAENIQDKKGNATRFLILGFDELGKTGQDKTSLVLMTEDKPGSLVHILMPFAKHQINMTKIESRPSPTKNWHYVFFVDIEGHLSSSNLKAALAELDAMGATVKILGSYPSRRTER